MATPTLEQLRRALHLGEQIEKLKAEMVSIFGERIPKAAKSIGDKAPGLVGLERKRKKPRFSKAARARIAAAQKARWAKVKAGKAAKLSAKAKKPKASKKGRMSAAGRANIVKAQKARWAKIKAEKGKRKG